MLFIEGMLT